MGVKELLKLDKEALARHAQEGWNLANSRTADLMKILQAFKRGTPASHIFCECKKCDALYRACQAVNPYEMPKSSGQRAADEKEA